jgi:hypothetical protein
LLFVSIHAIVTNEFVAPTPLRMTAMYHMDAD